MRQKSKSTSGVTRVSEAQLQQTATEWLALDGWRHVVTDPPQLRGLGVSEKGIPDRLHIRYFERWQQDVKGPAPMPAGAEVLWIEWKRKKNPKTSAEQLNWHAAERARGGLVWLAGEQFAADFEAFKAYYLASGLARRVR